MSRHPISDSYSCFVGSRLLASGSLESVAKAARTAIVSEAVDTLLIFDNSSGRAIDIDTRGSEEEMLKRLGSSGLIVQEKHNEEVSLGEPRRPGRPRLGVVSREVTLLPRHWAWLADQPGGASVALRKLVEQARKESAGKDSTRAANERAYNFMSSMAGDLAGFEEAIRALFSGDRESFEMQIANWPEDIRHQVSWLAFGRVRVQNA